MANALFTLGEALEICPKAQGERLLPPSSYPLNLLLEWPKRTKPQWAVIVGASLAIHILVFSIAVKLPSLAEQREPEQTVIVHRIPLYLPPDVMTQREPNRNKISKQIDLADLMAAKESQAHKARPKPSVKHFEIPKTAPQVAKANPQILPEAPKVAVNQPPAPLPQGSPTGLTAPPPPAPAAAPSPFQDIGTDAPPNPHPTLHPPKVDLDAAMNGVTPAGNSQQLSLSDDSAGQPRAGAPGVPGQAAAQHSAIELKSDPQGADFKPYLRQILAIVRANWKRVIPESVRLGQLHGRTVVEFAINRDGSLPKIVIAEYSGSDALDRAAAAGLTMSNPLPPLPADFKGSQVRLAFTFAYNMPSQ
ncbi:MAG: TonB family protein [Acidobacteriaceae bacterium]|nr:TonB family protein [Acidobacteriaceae bacterium]